MLSARMKSIELYKLGLFRLIMTIQDSKGEICDKFAMQPEPDKTCLHGNLQKKPTEHFFQTESKVIKYTNH